MKQRLWLAAVVALSAAGLISSAAHAAIRESVTFTNVNSMDVVGDADNVKQNFSLTGGYPMATLHITGVITNPNSTASRPNQCYVRAKRPDGVFTNIQLSQVSTLVTPPATLGTVRATLGLDGYDPAGNWEFEFFENPDNLPNGADMMWSSITFDFEDNLGGPTGADVRLCQVYGLYQAGRVGDTVGLGLGTTSWNTGTRNLIWSAEPDSRHPFIVTNMYRLLNDRFEQIGVSWVKHGFFALSNTQCGGSCNPTNGTFLGVGCTDTYDPQLNADQTGLGPRFEIDPWKGGFTYSGSVYANQGPAPNAIARRLQVKDADLEVNANLGSQYYYEGCYICRDDSDVMSSAAYKLMGGVSGSPGFTWGFTQSSQATLPITGFALQAWPGSTQVILAQEVPVNEATSPDGRCLLAYKVTDNGNGTWHYEYALMNIDMSRQVGDFVVDAPDGVNVTNIGFHAPNHTETLNLPAAQGGVPIDNAAWTGTRQTNAVRWSTGTNPLRWGTLYNFRFDADRPPVAAGVHLNLFTAGAVGTVDGLAQGPQAPPAPPAPCPGDADGNGVVNFGDITSVLANFGADYTPGTGAGDADHNGPVNFADITSVLANFGVPCPV